MSRWRNLFKSRYQRETEASERLAFTLLEAGYRTIDVCIAVGTDHKGNWQCAGGTGMDYDIARKLVVAGGATMVSWVQAQVLVPVDRMMVGITHSEKPWPAPEVLGASEAPHPPTAPPPQPIPPPTGAEYPQAEEPSPSHPSPTRTQD